MSRSVRREDAWLARYGRTGFDVDLRTTLESALRDHEAGAARAGEHR